MWVCAKERIRIKAGQPDCQITYAAQEGSRWLAFLEPDVVPELPWRVQHKYLNVRLSEERFLEMFEDIHSEDKQDS